MLARLQRYLAPPTFADEDQTRTAAMLNTTLLATGAVIVVTVVISSLLGVVNYYNALVAMVLAVIYLGLRTVLKRGAIRLATLLMSAVLLLATSIAVFNLGTTRVVHLGIYLFVVITPTLLIGPRTGMVFALLSLAAVFGLSQAERAGWLPTLPPPGPLNQWLIFSALMLLSVSLINLFRRSLLEALARARQEIAERQRTEAQLRAAEAKYRHLVEHLPGITFQISLTEPIAVTYISPQVETMLGFAPDEWTATPEFWPSRVHPDDLKNLVGALRASAETESGEMEYRMMARGGQYRWFRSRMSILRDSAGQPYAEGFTQDITAYKRAFDYVQQSEAKYRALFESASDAIFLMQGEQFVDCNARTLSMFGCERQQIIGQSPVRFSPAQQPDGESSQAKALQKIGLALSGAPQSFEWRHCRYDGALFEAEVSLNRIDLEKDAFLLAIVRDVTERRQAEAALRENEARLRLMIEHMPVMVDVKDADGNIRLWNRECERVTGYSAAEMIGNPRALELLYPDPAYRERMVAEWRARGNNYVGWAWTLTAKDGSARTIEWSNISERVPLLNWSTWSIGIDVTERRRAEEAEQRYAARMEMLHEIDRAILAARSPEETALAALTRIRQMVPCRRASVTLFDFQIQEARLLAVSVNGQTHLSPGRGISFDVFGRPAIENLQQGRPWVIEDLPAQPDLTERDQRFIAQGVRAWLTLPLFFQGELIGALNLGREQPGPFSAEDVEVAREVADQLAIAIQQARLLAETTEALAREERLNAVARTISSTLDLPTLLEKVVRLAAELVGAEAGLLGLVSPDGEKIEAPYAFNLPPALSQGGWSLPKGQGIAWHIVTTGQSVLLPDYGSHPSALPGWVAAGVRGFVGVPLVAGETILGASVLIDLASGHRFTRRDLALFETVGRQAGVAIQIARLFQATQRRVQELAGLHEIAQAFNNLTDVRETYGTLAERMARLIGAERCFVMLLGADGWAYPQAPGYGVTDKELSALEWPTERLADAPLLQDYGERGFALVNSVDELPQFFQDLARSFNVQTALMTPLKHEKVVIGQVVMVNKPGGFSADDARLLGVCAAQAAVVIQNARLYESEHAARVQTDTLLEVACTVSSTLSLREVLLRILQEAARVLPFVSGSITVYENGAPTLMALAGHEGREEVVMQAAYEDLKDSPILSRLLTEREPQIIADVDHDPEWVKYPETAYIRSWLGVPLIAHDRVIGVLSLDGDRPQQFAAQHLATAQALAAQAAVAIENARLFTAEHTAREQAEVLRAASAAVAQSLNLDSVLDSLLDHMHRLVPYDSASVFLVSDSSHVMVRAARGYERWMGAMEELRGNAFDISTLPNLQALIATQQSLLIPDTAEYPGWARDVGAGHVRSWIGIPLIAEGRVFGIYSLDKALPRFFTDAHVRLAEVLSAQGAIAIQNARFFEQVNAGRDQLQALSRRLVEVQEEERRHLARELHDEVGQMLTGLKLLLGVIPRLPAADASRKIEEAQGVLSQLTEQVHNLSLDLRPVILDDLGLTSALLWLFERYTAQTAVRVNFESVGLENRLPPEVETTTYRIVQEALTNVARYAQVQQAWVRLRASGDRLRLQIEDRGRGFDVETALASGQRAGIAGMKERAVLLGGWLHVESTPDAGTNVAAVLPLKGQLERRRHDRLDPVGG